MYFLGLLSGAFRWLHSGPSPHIMVVVGVIIPSSFACVLCKDCRLLTLLAIRRVCLAASWDLPKWPIP